MFPPIISARLPPPPGPLPVGYVTLTHPPAVSFAHPSPTITATGKPALRIVQVGYSIFYPCETAGVKKWARWVPEPFAGVVRGYEKFMKGKGGMVWLVKPLSYIAGRLQMPVYPIAPLLPPATPSYPLVIFSHGLAGTRNTYSQFCSALASEGYVVISMEHHDGSGPAALVPADEGEGDGERTLHYIHQDDISWTENEKPDLNHARTLQLELRTREVYEAYHSFKRLLSTEGDEKIVIEGLEGAKRAEWIDGLKGKVDLEDLRLTGHSFGGGTMASLHAVLHLLQTAPPSPDLLPPLPAKQALALDPWLDPMPAPSDTLSVPPTIPPVFVINTAGFTEWNEHFVRLVQIMKGVKGTLITMVGITHQSFSDFPLLGPTGSAQASRMITKVHDLSLAFLKRELASSPSFQGKTPDNGEYEKEDDGVKIKGKKGMVDGDIIVHLVGKE